nr:uncharacterized protein LOC119627231 isoform X1 [Chlorocebus sabaeus]
MGENKFPSQPHRPIAASCSPQPTIRKRQTKPWKAAEKGEITPLAFPPPGQQTSAGPVAAASAAAPWQEEPLTPPEPPLAQSHKLQGKENPQEELPLYLMPPT